MAGETALTVQVLDETPAEVALVGLTMVNPDVTNDNIIVNTDKSWLAVWADGHDATVIATISPDTATVDTQNLGELDVDNVVLTLAASDVAPQMGFVKIPAGFNTAGKITIVWTSGGGAWIAGEVKVGLVRLQ